MSRVWKVNLTVSFTSVTAILSIGGGPGPVSVLALLGILSSDVITNIGSR